MSRINQISDKDNWVMSIYAHKNRNTEDGNRTVGGRGAKDVAPMVILR